jgi:type II secretory pathway pseudopilin PulG
MHFVNHTVKFHAQQGVALLVLTVIIALIASAAMIQFLNQSNIKQLKAQKTQVALAEAKQALLAYASKEITPISRTPPLLRCVDRNNDNAITSVDSPYSPANCNCGFNCARPGDLPCPDRNNDGNAEINCNTQANRLGRLPWKTLGIDDLRDGAGERLWYAVSERFKNNTRILPLNSETNGSISLKDPQGNLINSAMSGSGLVAIIIAPNEILTRADNMQQNRSTENINNPQHYLDIIANEDNADFVENSANGFILGTPSQDDTINDISMTITKTEMSKAMETRVLSEVMQALLFNFCPNQVKINNRSCNATTAFDFFPDPALVTDSSCLGSTTISACHSEASVNFGRIPVSGNANWSAKDVNSILRGDAEHNWFQQNGWRELIFYARAPACQETTKNCSGSGFLSLNGAITPKATPANSNKKMVLIAAGSVIATQTRASNADKTTFANYIEDENLAPLDDIFARYAPTIDKNDRATSVP